jgi:hypothetical protein
MAVARVSRTQYSSIGFSGTRLSGFQEPGRKFRADNNRNNARDLTQIINSLTPIEHAGS